MFRTRKNAEQIPKKKNLIFNNNESSTDECSNPKNSLYQKCKKQSSKIEILKNISASKDISSIMCSEKKKSDLKDDYFIKEIINNDNENILKTNEKFISLVDNRIDNYNDFELKINKKNLVDNQLMSKNSLRRNFNNKKESLINGIFKKNIMKKNKTNNLNNHSKLKLNKNGYINQFSTPKSNNKYLKSLYLNIKENDKNSSKRNFRNTSFSQHKFQDINEIKQKKIEKIMQIINNNNLPPSINVNTLKNEKNNFESVLSNKIYDDANHKRIYTLPNNFKFTTNKNSTRNQKKLMLKFYNYNRQRTYTKLQSNDININEIFNNDQLNINSLPNTNKHKSSNKYIFYRKNHTENNINTDFSTKAKISRNNTIKIESNRQNSFDSSFRLMNKSTDKIDKTHHKGSKINEKNYKTKLNNIQSRMTTLIGNLINYIEILKKDK